MPDELLSKGVQLWDKNGASATLNNGSGLLLHPETELKYVSMTTSSGIVSSGNNLKLDGPTAWTTGGIGTIVSGSFCPLEKVNIGALGGDTQYANMYTGGIESAAITEIPGSTGYGTIINAISTITSVRPTTGTNSATNSYIPTERAVALALAGKENILEGGACIELDKDVFSTTVSVKTQSGTLPTLANAVNTQVPTERCVRQAIDVTSETLNASAAALSNRINTLSTYVENSAVKYTDSATADSLGIVKPGHGISAGNGGVLNLVSAPVVSSSGGSSAYQVAWGMHVVHSWGGVVCANEIDSAGLIKYESAAIVPTVQAVYNYVSAHGGGGGGAVVSQGTGITVTSDTPLTSYTVTLNSAQESVIGGVKVPSGKGIVLNAGSIYLGEAPFTANEDDAYAKIGSGNIGGVLVTNNIYNFYDASDYPVVPNVTTIANEFRDKELAFNITKYTAAGTTDGYRIKGGFIFAGDTYITSVDTYSTSVPTSTSVTSLTIYLHLTRGSASSAWTVASPAYVTTTNTESDTNKYIVIGQLSIFHYENDHVITSIKQVQTGNIDLLAGTGGGGAGYAGPFHVTSAAGTVAVTKVNVTGGYVKWLDGNTWVGGSDTSTQTPITSWTLSSATSHSTSGWVFSSGGSWYTPDKTALYLVGSSGAVAGQAITAHTYSATVGGKVYTRTESSNNTTSRFKWTSGTGTNIVSMWADQNLGLDTVAYDADTGTTSIGTVTDYKGTITVGGVAYVKSSTDTDETGAWVDTNGNVQYTASAWPLSGQSTLYNIDQKFGYSTSQGALPPAGAFYTMLAQNQGGTIVQQQYGTVWHEHWGDDYKGQFAISRVALTNMSATQLPTPNTYPYAYIIGRGGRLYGGIPFNQGRFWGGLWSSSSLLIPPSDIWYPTSDVNGTTKNDALYFKYGTVNEVWLNIWSGTWPTTYGGTEQDAAKDMWYVVAHPECLEGKIPNCYSVQLGWVTGNGAPQQEHKGAIAIRGRWA